jgi:hypothetical protein
MIDFYEVHNPPPMSSCLVVFILKKLDHLFEDFGFVFRSYYSFSHLSITNEHIGQIWCWFGLFNKL